MQPVMTFISNIITREDALYEGEGVFCSALRNLSLFNQPTNRAFCEFQVWPIFLVIIPRMQFCLNPAHVIMEPDCSRAPNRQQTCPLTNPQGSVSCWLKGVDKHFVDTVSKIGHSFDTCLWCFICFLKQFPCTIMWWLFLLHGFAVRTAWYDIYSSCYYHHQIGSINLSHCYHIFPWSCVWDVYYIIFCHIPGKLGFCSHHYCTVYDECK